MSLPQLITHSHYFWVETSKTIEIDACMSEGVIEIDACLHLSGGFCGVIDIDPCESDDF